jgi:8-oxo-dGTP pyrophosphatase MutT (NUDIX family)
VDVVGSREQYTGAWVSVREDTLRGPDGTLLPYTVVTGADGALVIPLSGDRLHLVEQYRHPVGGRRWEFPSGSVDPTDTDPAVAAVRELREETGLVAEHVAPLGSVEVWPSTMTQRCHVFLATGLREGPHRRETSEQDMRARWFTRSEVATMVREGAITDGKSLAAYALLLTTGSVTPPLSAL